MSLKDELLSKNPFSDIVGQESGKKQLASALLAGRHVIIVGPPGIGKTTLARNVAKLLPELVVNDCAYHCLPSNPLCPECRSKAPKTKKITGIERFIRIQGSPDLTVEDLLGDIDPVKALKFGPTSLEAFTPGKIFLANNGVLFFDEVNRCPEKLQNALLQVLEEGCATLGAYRVDIPADFIFIATMNPEETAATEPLSEAFLDRFDIITMNYPETVVLEEGIVVEKGAKLAKFSDALLRTTIGFIHFIRSHKDLSGKPSVRASIGLYERAQANALLSGRNNVVLKDIEDAIISVLSKRIALKPSVKYLQTPVEFLKKAFADFQKEEQQKNAGDGGL